MKKTILAMALMAVTGVSQAAITHTMTNGRFDFKDASGAVTADGHNDVQGAFDLVNGTGTFTTSTNFVGYAWNADVTKMNMHNTLTGGTNAAAVEAYTYDWTVESYFINGATTTCVISNGVNGCGGQDANVAAGAGFFLGSAANSIAYNLTAGQFAAETLFDWSVNLDIPVLAIMQVTNDAAADGFMVVASVDLNGQISGNPFGTNTVGTVNDGSLYGVPMPSCAGCGPFPNQTPIFSGTIVPVSAVPVPAAVWLFGSGLLGLAGVARRRKAS